MILPNNPEIDVDELMTRVRRDAARLRESGAIEARRNAPRAAGESDLSRAVDRHRTVTAVLNQAEKKNAPRTEVPRRMAALPALRPALSFALRVFNYAFKQQREFNTTMLLAAREGIVMLATVGEAAARMERERDRSNPEIIGNRLAALRVRLQAVDANAKQALERLDSAESVLREAGTDAQTFRTRTDFAHQRIDSLETTLRALSARLEASPTRAEARRDLVDALRETERRISVGDESLLRNEAILRGELLALRRSMEPDGPVAQRSQAVGSFAGDALHAALGDEFRGDRDLIAKRLSTYVPLVVEAATVNGEHPLLDIGSGRGEWLAVLRDANIPAFGCDSNELLATQAITAGLEVRHQDGLEVLRNAPTSSLGAVTAFHVVEHLAFDDLYLLLAEAQRALTPGGILILETPDPRNILVSTRTFYLDPTHRHPVPAELLEFLVTSLGYVRIEQKLLHEPDRMLFSRDTTMGQTLNEIFSRAQDYAIVGYAPRA